MGDLSESAVTTCSDKCAVIEGAFSGLPGEKRTFLGVCFGFRGDLNLSSENLEGVFWGVLVGVIQERGTLWVLVGVPVHFLLEGDRDRGDAENSTELLTSF